jgi:hypothetical protein
MPLSKLSLRELEALEAEIALALSDSALPPEKRRDLEERLAAIREKVSVLKPQ